MRKPYERFIVHCFLLTVVFLCIFPLLWMITTSFKSSDEVFTSLSLFPKMFRWENYQFAWTQGNFKLYFKNSIIYTLLTLVGVVFFSSMAAFAFSQAKFKGHKIIFYFFIASMMIPIPGAFIPLYVLLIKLGLANTMMGLVLPYINSGLALAIFILKGFFDDVPKELNEAATIDGCGPFGAYWHIYFPLARPAIMTVCIFTALSVWNEILLAMVLINKPELMPIQRGVLEFQGQHFTDYPVLMSALTIATIPILIIYFLLQRQIIKGLAEGALKE